MTRSLVRRRVRGDDGISLVLALVFILVVALFATVALTKAQSTLISGSRLRERGQLQYTLDGAVEDGFSDIRADMTNADPTNCAQAAAPSSTGQIVLNGMTSTWTCTLLAGRAKKSSDATLTDYAAVVTSPASGALTAQSGCSRDLVIQGSIYVNGSVQDSDLCKTIKVQAGDYVSPNSRAGCDTDLSALTHVTVTAGYVKTCTDETLNHALPVVALPAAPTQDLTPTYGAGTDVVLGVAPSTMTCRVFFPGRYSAAPALRNGGNYFVSGLYYFAAIGTWSPSGNHLQVVGGARALATDSDALSGDCSGMTDSLALAQPTVLPNLAAIQSYSYPRGVTWVLGGNSHLDLPTGEISLFTPPQGASSRPMSLVAVANSGNGYAAISAASGTPTALTGTSNNTVLRINGKIYAPSALVDIFSTQSTEAVARGGVVAYKLTLQSSAAGADGLAISAPSGFESPPPPFRTILMTSDDTSGGTTVQNKAVATVSNYTPYVLTVKSWRTK